MAYFKQNLRHASTPEHLTTLGYPLQPGTVSVIFWTQGGAGIDEGPVFEAGTTGAAGWGAAAATAATLFTWLALLAAPALLLRLRIQEVSFSSERS